MGRRHRPSSWKAINQWCRAASSAWPWPGIGARLRARRFRAALWTARAPSVPSTKRAPRLSRAPRLRGRRGWVSLQAGRDGDAGAAAGQGGGSTERTFSRDPQTAERPESVGGWADLDLQVLEEKAAHADIAKLEEVSGIKSGARQRLGPLVVPGSRRQVLASRLNIPRRYR